MVERWWFNRRDTFCLFFTTKGTPSPRIPFKSRPGYNPDANFEEDKCLTYKL